MTETRRRPAATILPAEVIVRREAMVLGLIRGELLRVRQPGMYPMWPVGLVEGAAIASEESGEVVKAVNTYVWGQGSEGVEEIFLEGVQAAAMWVRFLVESVALLEVGDAGE